MPRSRHDVNAQVKRQAQRTDHLRAALLNRDVIGQAKGIIMERYNIDADAAFSTLKRISQAQNMKLHEVARNDAAIIKLNVRGQQAAGPRIVRAATSHARATRPHRGHGP
jgi:ribosomal protein S13